MNIPQIGEQELRDLAKAVQEDARVISLYMSTDTTQNEQEYYRLVLRGMLKGIGGEADAQRIATFFDNEYDWSGKGFAVFSCAPKGFWRSYILRVPVPDRLFVADRPSVRTLADLVDDFGYYGVVLVDKEGARLSFLHLGELLDHVDFKGEEVRQQKLGGASTVAGRRGGVAGRTHYVDELIEKNMRASAQAAVRFFEEHTVRRVFLAGSEDNTALFRDQLPKAWQERVISTLAFDPTGPETELLEDVVERGAAFKTAQEAQLTADLVTAAAKGQAVAGVRDTLTAVSDRRADLLVIGQDLHLEGWQCPNCHLLSAESHVLCPRCNERMEPAPDIIETAAAEVLRTGGDVEVVSPNDEFVRAGSIGATLRF
jgi:peptide subunit release factor 1 (eRF1)